MTTDMGTMRRMLELAKRGGRPRMSILVTTVDQMLQEYDDRAAMLTAFRHAANSIGVEAGVIVSHVDHDEVAASVTGDAYFLELIREAELRLNRLSVKYERLRAAAIPVLADYDLAIDALEHEDEAAESREMADALKEALKDDH